MQKHKLTEEERGFVIRRISETLEKLNYILFAYVFGSFASGESFGDIDIGIYVMEVGLRSPLKIELRLETELESALHMPVDVRILNDAPLSFTYNVLKRKILIVDRDSTMRADFEGLICKKYFDFRHLRREYLREIVNAPI